MIPYLLAIAGGYLLGNATKDKQLFAGGGDVFNEEEGGVYQDWEDVYYKDDRYKEWMNRLDKKTNKVIGQENIIYLPYQDLFRVYKIEYAKGGGVDNVKKIIDGDDVWYLTYIDSTHFFLSNSQDFKGNAYHIGQFRGRPFYDEVNQWLKSFNKSYAKGGGVGDEFYKGQSIIMRDTFPYYDRMTKEMKRMVSPYYNKELVIDEIINNKPHNLARAFVRSSGQKVPFEIKLNKKYIEKYAKGGGIMEAGYTIKGRKGRYWIDDVQRRLPERYYETKEEVESAFKNLVRIRKDRAKQVSINKDNLIESDRFYAKGGDVKRDATLLVISSENPLAKQLYKLEGESSWQDIHKGEPSLIDVNGNLYIVYTKRHLDNIDVDENIIKKDLDYLKKTFNIDEIWINQIHQKFFGNDSLMIPKNHTYIDSEFDSRIHPRK
jgi:hypothetical protein